MLEVKNHFLQEYINQEFKDQVSIAVQEIRHAHEQRLRGHLSNLRGEIKKAQNETKQEIMKHTESEIAGICSHVGLVPFGFTMPDFEQKKTSNSSWYSPSFYTHPHGYKMCLRVDANGYGIHKNSSVAVCLCMMRGEYDESLKWPFRGDITVQLLNQVGYCGGHHMLTIHLTDHADDELQAVCGRVVSGERSSVGWGYHNFSCHSNLVPNYLKDDCLKLCIKEVKLK